MKNEWKNKWIAAGIAAVAMAVVISGVFLFLRSGRQMSVKDAYYIQDGEMVSSEGSWRLTFDKNKGTTLKGHGVRKNLTDDGTVIYYKLENKVLRPRRTVCSLQRKIRYTGWSISVPWNWWKAADTGLRTAAHLS